MTASLHSAATLSAVLEGLPHPALIVDSDRRIRAANALFRARVLAGRRLLGAHCYEVLHGRARPCHADDGPCPLNACLRGDPPPGVIHAHAVPEGWRHEAALVQPIHDNAGRVVGCLTTLRRASP